jgi:hypothetical protein
MNDDRVGAPRVQAPELNEHQRRLADALALAMATNHPPKLATMPAVMVNWDFSAGILTIAHCKAAELEVHLVYLRICDIQTTFGQMMDVAAQTKARTDKYLRDAGEVMACVRSPKLL